MVAARLPTYYSNKWRESAKKVEARYGEYTFANFVEFTQESSLDANHPVFSHDAQQEKNLREKRTPLLTRGNGARKEKIRRENEAAPISIRAMNRCVKIRVCVRCVKGNTVSQHARTS